uniref:Uncharacterized membrane protein n=1 Tax=Candidatus Kentrum sp. SD TaxID=2126332 RepID=A0A450YQL8_9GAMM|nr:MAG: Uncharacterized membrane protein [Candidatus Kentron sp. SD]VFK43837.1 MAG: Uncharacterized membrane protein [Candidatus Kentron sp. SD]
MNEAVAHKKTTTEGMAKIVYILYPVGIFFGFTGIIGVVMAYINRSDAPDWLKSHYQFQIRTFWIGVLYMLIAAMLASVVIGYLILLFWVVWLIIRCVKGIKSLDQKEAHPNPTGWLF